MAKYQVQTPDGSIITVEGPDGASQDEIIQQAQLLYTKPQPGQSKSAKEYVKDFAKSSASLADMGINMVTGALDQGAYALARAGGLSPEQATKETTSPKDFIGRAAGITQDPAYQNEASRQLMGYVGENIERSVAEPVSQVTGLPQQDVSNMLGTASMMIPGAVKAVKPAAQATGAAISDVAKGAIGRGTGYIAEPGVAPKGFQVESSRIPLTDRFTKPEDWAKFQRGELPYGEFPPTTPIQELPTNALERSALALSGGEIPAAGQGFKAFGERLGETYRNPLTAAADIGSMFFTGGIPVISTARGGLAAAQAAADALLARKGFDPMLPKQMEAYRTGQMPMPGQAPKAGPVNPATIPNYPLTVQGPGQQLPPSVMPMGTNPRAVNIEGQRSTLPYQIDTSNSRTQTPKQVSMDIAASKIEPAAPQPAPVQQAPATAPKPVTKQPAPVKPTGTVKELEQQLQNIDEQTTQLHSENVGRVQPDTPAGSAYRNQMDEMYRKYKDVETQLELAKKAEKEAEKKAKAQAKKESKKKGPEVSKMMTEEDKNKFFNKIKSSGESEVEQKVAGMSQANRDQLAKTLKGQLSESTKDLIQPYLDAIEKYRTNK